MFKQMEDYYAIMYIIYLDPYQLFFGGEGMRWLAGIDNNEGKRLGYEAMFRAQPKNLRQYAT